MTIATPFLLVLLLLQPALAQDAATPVNVARVQLAEVVEEVPLTGTVISSHRARLSTEISGLIDRIGVEAGDKVKQDDVILRLKLGLEKLSLEASEAELEQARRELADAKRRLEDAERLGRSNTISANEINALKAEVSIDSTVVSRLQAEEAQQRLRLRLHTLRAPFSGVISRREVEQGEWVDPGETVVELVSLDAPEIEFQVPQRVYQRLDDVSRIQLRFDAIPGERFGAERVAVVPVTDRVSRTFSMRTRLNTDDPRLIPGLSASATLFISNRDQGVVVNRNALTRYPDGRVSVWVVTQTDGTSKVSEKSVVTGLSFDGRINITAGLEAGATIVVNGNESLREGQSVSIKQTLD